MKFSTRQDIEAPADFVFSQISDFDSLERQAMRRGIEVTRKSQSQPRGAGAGWTLKVPFRGKLRDLEAEITDFDAPNALAAAAQSGGLNMAMTAELVPLSADRTRVTFGYDVRPQTLSARILVQSVKFAKATIQKRFEKRMTAYCAHLAEHYAGAAKR